MHRNSGGILASYAYTLNKAGIRTKVLEVDSSQVVYGYDNLYRLISEARTGTHAYMNAFVYDSVGNRKKQFKGTDTLSYTYNNRDQLLSVSGPGGDTIYDYDAAGRQTKRINGADTLLYGWEDQDRMASVTGPGVAMRYTYDADGQRVKDSTASTVNQYLIDALLPYGQVVAKSNGAGSQTVSYAYGLERISQTVSGTASYFLPDGQASIRQLGNGAGNVTDEDFYTAFGENLYQSGSSVNDFKYLGEQLDPNIAFYYLRARWMNPLNGNFVGSDRNDGLAIEPKSLHRYLYANSSPINFIDPSGRMSMSPQRMGDLVHGYIELDFIHDRGGNGVGDCNVCSSIRIDLVDFDLKDYYEIKKNNSTEIRRGRRQLEERQQVLSDWGYSELNSLHSTWINF